MKFRRIISILALLSLLLVGYGVLASPSVRGIEKAARVRASGSEASQAAQFDPDDIPATIVHEAVEPVSIDLRNPPTDIVSGDGQLEQQPAGEIDLGVKPLLTLAEIAALQAQALEFKPDGDIQTMRSGPGLLAPVPGTNFDSLDSNECCGGSTTVVPPDPEMSAGPNHLIAVVNIAYEIYDKSGTTLVGPATLASFFSPLGGTNCSAPFDPNTLYDEKADRFMIAADGNGNAYCVGVSQTNDPTGAWWLYEFPTNVGGNFFDYPHAGIGDDAIYMGANMFAAVFAEGRVWAFDKAAMYAGGVAGSVSHTTGADGTPQPVNLHGFAQGTWPSSGPHYILTDRNFNGQTYELYSWNDPFGADTFTDITTFDLPATHGVTVGQAIPNVQPVPGQTIEGNDFRPLDFEYRNGSGWTAMTVSCNPGGGTVNCIQWAEIDLSTPALVQTGVFASSGEYRYFPDVAANHCGDAAVGYTKSGSSTFPAVWATGRESTDPLGTMQAEVQLKAGELVYAAFDGAPLRWGDYTGMTIDPDGLTFWYLGEYSKNNGNGSANWGNYISSLSYPNCSTASIDLQKTVGTDPNVCATTDTIDVLSGTDVYYCYEVTNTGGVTLTIHDLVDSELPSPILSSFPFSLTIGSSVFLTDTVNITQTTINTATWTAYNPGPTDLVTATGTATVTLILEPAIVVDSASLSGVQLVDVQVTHPITITNGGLADLDWSIFEDNPVTAVTTSFAPTNAIADLALSLPASTPRAERRAAAPNALLYDQTDNIGTNGAPSQVFPDFGNDYLFAADDFTVPAGGWTITGTLVLGQYSVGPAPAWDVYIYADSGGMPGSLIYSYADLVAASDISGDVTLVFPVPAALRAGTYWLSVVADMALVPTGQWFWNTRSVQTGNPYHWTENGLLGTPCNGIWGPGASVCGVGGGVEPDLLFALYGSPGGTCLLPEADIPWVSVDPITGTTPAGLSTVLDVTFDSTGLSTGLYTGTLCIDSNAANAPLVAVPLTMTVELDPARLQVAHLAPFAMDPGTAVTITLNGSAVLTDFAYTDSTGYLDLTPGSYLVEIFPGGSASPAITGTVDLLSGMDYTAIAIGDGVNQPLSLLALVDDNTVPAAGNFKLRLGHLAPFANTLAGTMADIRLDDGTAVLTDVVFGALSPYLELPAGTYDLKITTPGGGTTLINLAPVSFNDGDILSAFATGDGVNQPLGGYALPSGQMGFVLPLEEYKLYLPLVIRN